MLCEICKMVCTLEWLGMARLMLAAVDVVSVVCITLLLLW